jgi:CrcB protein
MAHAFIAGLGGFIGSVLRYWLSAVAQRWVLAAFPVGTLLVNVLGCLVIGAVMYLVDYREMFTPELRVFVTIGILGGFTTFSTFGYETVALLQANEYPAALTNVAANVVLGIGAVILGWTAAKLL